MKNASKKNWLGVLPLFLLLPLPAPKQEKLPEPVSATVTCLPPEANVTNHGSGSASFAWDAVDGATEYKIYYTRQEDVYTSSPVTTGGTSFTFSNLPAGTYDFYFCTVCGGGSSSNFVIDDLGM